jgi:hypothetical protein
MTGNHYFGMFIGIPAFAWLIWLTSWQVGVAVFLLMWANNLSQTSGME